MTEEESPTKRHRRTVLYGVVIAAAWLALTGLFGVPFLPPEPRHDDPPASAAATRRQVVIFVVDTQDAFDAHGAQVRSVIQRHCPLCTTRPINLHGDLSSRNIVEALLHVDDLSRQYDADTTLLVNVSLGSYGYDEVLHAQVRRLRDAGLIFIAAAGNDDRDDPFYPAALPEVVGVCSSTRHSREKSGLFQLRRLGQPVRAGLAVRQKPAADGHGQRHLVRQPAGGRGARTTPPGHALRNAPDRPKGAHPHGGSGRRGRPQPRAPASSTPTRPTIT